MRNPAPTVTIIYNPNATGDAPEMAQDLLGKLKTAGIADVAMSPTRYAGNAEELAYEAVKRDPQVVLVSVSGDWGYHEVVNGAVRAGREQGARPRCAVLGAGNANDHYRTVNQRPPEEAIAGGAFRAMDLLRVEVRPETGETVVRYAHSYAGLGLTPLVAVELNRHELNRFKELLIALRTFLRAEAFELVEAEKPKCYRSIIFGNINQMAKVMTISEAGNPFDGKFEITSCPASSRLALTWYLVRTVLTRAKAERRTDHYHARLVKGAPIQLDGEIIDIPAGAELLVTTEAAAVDSLIA